MRCRKCNVEVADYLERCPLCKEALDSRVINNTYNTEIEDFSRNVNIEYYSNFIIKLLVLANIICLICNITINKTVSWSLYVIFSSIYAYSFMLYFILKNKKISFVINMISLELLLFIISYLTKTTRWFIYLVGPFILLFIILILLMIYLSKHKNILRNTSCLLIYVALILNTINACINMYKSNDVIFTWSIISNIPIIIISILLMALSFSKKISDEIEKRFFI